MERLSDVYKNANPQSIAQCPNCKKEYIDDTFSYGSLISPCCPPFALYSVLVKENDLGVS